MVYGMAVKSSIAEVLRDKGYIVYTNKGVSMMPLLRQDRDLMVIERKVPGQLKNHDAVLFVRTNGQYVLHRILKVRPDDYWIVGDNCIGGEFVKEEQIIGVLTGVVRDGKKISVTDPLYKLYVHVWCDVYPVRFMVLRARRFAGRVYHKLRRMTGLE